MNGDTYEGDFVDDKGIDGKYTNADGTNNLVPK